MNVFKMKILSSQTKKQKQKENLASFES